LGHDVEEWFIREIIPLEPMLERFLRRAWRNRDEIADIRQDTYVRVYERALLEKPFNPKHFLFQVARNLMIDRARRNNVLTFDSCADFDSVEAGQIDAEGQLAAQQEVLLLRSAITGLPTRCREVVTLRKVEGLSQREVARKMGITEDTVERQVANGVRFLRDRLLEKSAGIRPPGRAGGKGLTGVPTRRINLGAAAQ
jgi:RNA polymerase sigma-70 factor (ECF subfamily)